ncbi:2'-5' RNA ligase [Alicyclobacillus sacchari]|uniref:RNA 2',3'-cyclic phosphodiesterase n=1 Tax=Alicyclobacillus sacchari TaxID=392010 RepID=A0A4V3HEM2_9BACL|nr:RNA 2',3'-cyclic phosphodiesterase [Alicyclobacillus sacchari]TDY49521.1 2'-5' RNA ligase [Alicyclobacillus sacchari]
MSVTTKGLIGASPWEEIDVTARMFFGLELPMQWKRSLRAQVRLLREEYVRTAAWSNPDLVHITVLFLGMVDESDRSSLTEAGRVAAAQVKPIQLTTGHYGEFSGNRVFWLGLDRQESDWDELMQLGELVRQNVSERVRLDLDEKRFRPHITLARKLAKWVDVKKLPSPTRLTTVVTELCLFESLREDGQLAYPVRERFPLGQLVEGPPAPPSVDV